MTAVFRVNLSKAKHFRVSELTSELFFHAVQVFDFSRRECQTFLFVVSFEVRDILDRSRLDIHGKDFLIQTLVHTLQHRVMFSILILYGEVFFDTRNAVEIHVLGNLYSICTPRRNHFTSRSYVPALQRLSLFERSSTIKPAEFIHFVVRELMVHFRGNHALLRCFKKQNHIGYIFGFSKLLNKGYEENSTSRARVRIYI